MNQGVSFGASGSGFMRLNIGSPRATLAQVIERIQAALSARKKIHDEWWGGGLTIVVDEVVTVFYSFHALSHSRIVGVVKLAAGVKFRAVSFGTQVVGGESCHNHLVYRHPNQLPASGLFISARSCGRLVRFCEPV